MLAVTARLFKDNQLVGYRLSDGQAIQDFTKQQAWLYAKNKQILNVVATGTEADPGLSGTNGFELKKLPEVKWGETRKTEKYDTQDILAAYIEKVLKLQVPESKREGTDSATIAANYVNGNIERQRSYIIDPDIDRDEFSKRQKELFRQRVQLYDMKNRRVWTNNVSITALCIGGRLVAYKMTNKGSEPITVYKIPINQVQRHQIVTLEANNSIELSRAEMAATLSQIQFSCRAGNCKLVSGSKRYDNEYDILSGYYLSCELGGLIKEPLEVNNNTINYIITPEELESYADGRTFEVSMIEGLADFAQSNGLEHENIRNAAELLRESNSIQVKNTIQKLNNAKSAKDMFNAFKR